MTISKEANRTKGQLGKFGKLVKEYEKARRPYPAEVFSFLKNKIHTTNLRILDLGCGTGISTRQLAKFGSVVGCDPDMIMLRAARKYPKINKERYVVGSAHHLPFKNSVLDVVTAFASFHWFDDIKSISEIKRVLKPGGIFVVVNKVGLKSWGNGYRRTIIKSIGQDIARFQKDFSYNPKNSLTKHGFKKVKSVSGKSPRCLLLQMLLNMYNRYQSGIQFRFFLDLRL